MKCYSPLANILPVLSLATEELIWGRAAGQPASLPDESLRETSSLFRVLSFSLEKNKALKANGQTPTCNQAK